MSFTHPVNAIYLADPAFLSELLEELDHPVTVIENLVFSSVAKEDVIFARDYWLEPSIVNFESISEAAKILRQKNKYWYLYPLSNIRRSRLIESQLAKLPTLEHNFPLTKEIPNIGCFTLLDKNTLVFSKKRWKQPPLGDYQFIEDKTNPPNRAYLKLWEALTLCGHYPNSHDIAIDLGASPGGWTYVMQSFGTYVTAIDKSPLAPEIAKLRNVKFLQQSAFAFDLQTLNEPVDWVLCDVACYPERTYELITNWLASGKAKNLIFTIKLQGKTDFSILKKFTSIPNSTVIHLFYNKHEVTFIYPFPKNLTYE